MKDRMYVFPASSYITPSLRFPVPDYRMICYMGEDDRMQKILAGCFDRHLFECIPSFFALYCCPFPEFLFERELQKWIGGSVLFVLPLCPVLVLSDCLQSVVPPHYYRYI